MNFSLENMVVFILFAIPLIGTLNFCIIKIKSIQKGLTPSTKDHNQRSIFLMLISIFIFSGLTLLVLIFAIILCFFPNVKIPTLYKVIGIITLLGYWAIIGSIVTGLSDAVSAGSGSATRILNKILNKKKNSE